MKYGLTKFTKTK